ncbi:MAG TPA: O-antigen ligase domain-containing protein [Candidatus Dependentiae bacterium]|nr:O-antigen ligase domain-containing protein [Candidatus Dependentiae bacterium]
MPLYGKIIPPLIAIWVILWLINGSVKDKIINLRKSPVFFILVFFYLLHIIGMSYTENFSVGLFDLEVKFSILLLPILVFSNKDFFDKYRNVILSAFLSGNVIAALISIGVGYSRTLKYNINYLHYQEFSLFHHPSYSSMYALFSICIVIFFLFNKNQNNNLPSIFRLSFPVYYKLRAISLFVILCAFIYFLSSRTGIIAAILVIGFLIVYYIFKKKKWLFFLPLLIVFIPLSYLIIKNNPRFTPVIAFINTPLDSIKMDATENTMVRYNIACQSIELIKQNFFLGAGTGDVKESLKKRYQEKNIIKALHPLINAHNQFLETFIGLGIAGILSLLSMIFYPLYNGMKNGNVLLVAFSLTIIVNFMFESMLNTQAGIVFFAFFHSLLMCSDDGS